MIRVSSVNWEHYKKQHGIHDNSKAIVLPHNEFFFMRDKGFFETAEEKLQAEKGMKLYDFVMPNGKTIENVSYMEEGHFILYWAHGEITNLMPLYKVMEDNFSQSPRRALNWFVFGNRPPKWEHDEYVIEMA